MKPLTKLTLRNAFFSGLLFATVISLPKTEPFSIYMFMFSAITFGGIISLIDYYRQVYNLECVGITDPQEEDLQVHQSRTIVTEQKIDEIKDTLLSHELITRRSIISTENGFKAKTPWTISSCGERLEVRRTDTPHTYEISSSPNIAFGLGLDYGKNLMNIVRVEKVLSL